MKGGYTDKKPQTPGGTGIAPPEEKKALAHEEEKMLGGAERPKEIKAPEEAKLLESAARELEERLLRLQAEFENYKKRAERENEMLRDKAAADAMLKLLPIVDDFDMAMAHMDKSPHKEFKRGMELIYAKLLETLRKEGVEEMRALGESFDPYKHDALRQAEGDEGKVVEVVQKGYLLKGKVLRHAKVAVGKRK